MEMYAYMIQLETLHLQQVNSFLIHLEPRTILRYLELRIGTLSFANLR